MAMVREATHPSKKLELLKQVADVNESDGSWTNLAALVSHPQLVKLALSKGADVNQRTTAEYGSETVLIELAKSITGLREPSAQKSLQLIIDAKPDLDARDGDGCTALFNAILRENLKVAKVLIAAGADPNIANDDAVTVLEDLFTWGRLDDPSAAKLVRVLLESDKWQHDVLERAHARATAKGWKASAKLIRSRL